MRRFVLGDLNPVPFPITLLARLSQCATLVTNVSCGPILCLIFCMALRSGPLRGQAPTPRADLHQPSQCRSHARLSSSDSQVGPKSTPPSGSGFRLPLNRAGSNIPKAARLRNDEARLMAILVTQPDNAGALAGMGWIRSQEGNFLAALSFLEQARLQRPNDPALSVAIDLDRVRFFLSEAQYSVSTNDFKTAKQRYMAALEIRPNSHAASAGMSAILLRERQQNSLPESSSSGHGDLACGASPPA